MELQEILIPTFQIKKVGATFTNEGEIDLVYISSPKAGCEERQVLHIVERRYPSGRVRWFEEVKL